METTCTLSFLLILTSLFPSSWLKETKENGSTTNTKMVLRMRSFAQKENTEAVKEYVNQGGGREGSSGRRRGSVGRYSGAATVGSPHEQGPSACPLTEPSASASRVDLHSHVLVHYEAPDSKVRPESGFGPTCCRSGGSGGQATLSLIFSSVVAILTAFLERFKPACPLTA